LTVWQNQAFVPISADFSKKDMIVVRDTIAALGRTHGASSCLAGVDALAGG
jgi:hypothetical protein